MGTTAESTVVSGRSHIIERPRLTRLLDETSARVIMLVAPAGYGKTTLARQWLANRPHAWYQAGAASADVAALALGIAEASQQLVPGTGRRLREWLPTSREPAKEVETISELLASELAGWPDEAWFVIDDYHLLTSTASQDLTQELLAGRRTLLTSRVRPSWTSARDLLYGTIFELGTSALAMTPEEANAILDDGVSETANGLVALADGWPAVIGLAALAPAHALVESAMTDALHDFLAEELFSTLRPGAQRALCQLALLPTLDRALVGEILGADTEAILDEGAATGFFPARDDQFLSVHPLMRTFLLTKLGSSDPMDRDLAVDTAVRALMRRQLWHDAFSVVAEYGRLDLLEELISEGLHVLTRQGQLTTVREWLTFARERGFTSAYLDLASADLSFREGQYDRAALLASSAAASLPQADRLSSLAHCRAGQCEYFLDRVDRAQWHLRRARETAHTELDARNAVWGEFCLAADTEISHLGELLEEFEAIGPLDRDAEVRKACGLLTLALWDGGLAEALARTSPMRDLVSEATDPLARSMFWRGLAGVLVLAGQYASALEAVDGAILESEQSHLAFVRPHALISRVAALTGLQRFGAAHAALSEIDHSAVALGEPYLFANAAIVRCRLLLAENSIGAALSAVRDDPPPSASTGRHAEYSATRALALAAADKPAEARELAAHIRGVTGWLSAQLLVDWVEAIAALLLDEPEALSSLEAAYARCVETGALDVVVQASRVHPEVLAFLVERGFNPDTVGELSDRKGNVFAAGPSGGSNDRERAPIGGMTPREQEVLVLLARGQTNREIAQALVISEVTVKVHVRHILQKLGVRNRTEAARVASTRIGDAATTLDR